MKNLGITSTEFELLETFADFSIDDFEFTGPENDLEIHWWPPGGLTDLDDYFKNHWRPVEQPQCFTCAGIPTASKSLKLSTGSQTSTPISGSITNSGRDSYAVESFGPEYRGDNSGDGPTGRSD
jgi:hypothetical protein